MSGKKWEAENEEEIEEKDILIKEKDIIFKNEFEEKENENEFIDDLSDLKSFNNEQDNFEMNSERIANNCKKKLIFK